MNKPKRFAASALLQFASDALMKGGLKEEPANSVAATLLESDLMGHTTHGLALLGPYLKSLEQGHMTTSGAPDVIHDHGANVTWDGKLLPGAWLVHQAIDLALERIKQHPLVTVVIRRSHHIGCLAAYPERATEKGLVMLLACSDPAFNRVAPFGGLTGVYSPNPIAAGIPTNGTPIIFDISTSATAGGMVNQAYKSGKHLPHPWLLDAEGQATSDPTPFFQEPQATILPLGGLDTGYKGFALGLLVDALTGALGGYGRADQPNTWMSGVFLQLIDPEAFGGLEAFTREMQFVADRSRESAVRPGDPPVRLPGQRALQLRDQQRKEGVQLSDLIAGALEEVAGKYGLAMPGSLD